MPDIRVDLSGDHERVGRDMGIARKPVVHTTAGWVIDPMEHGMQSGATSLMVLIPAVGDDLQECVVAAETSLTCFISAATVLAAKFADEVNQPGWAILSPAARAVMAPRFAEAVRRATGCTLEKAHEAAAMIIDGMGADAPPDWAW